MSAYIVDREHIEYLITAAMSNAINGFQSEMHWWHNGESHSLPKRGRDRAQEVGQMLWNENIASVSHRYPRDTVGKWPGPVDENYIFEHHEHHYVSINAVDVLKAIRCYTYQSCEHDGWETSEAKAFTDSLTSRAISSLPGYDDAEWGAPKKCYKQKTE